MTCTCPGTSRARDRQVLSDVRRFVQHLRARGIVPRVDARPQAVPLVDGFLQWMHVHRGVSACTLTAYGSYVGDLVRVLGDDPRALGPAGSAAGLAAGFGPLLAVWLAGGIGGGV